VNCLEAPATLSVATPSGRGGKRNVVRRGLWTREDTIIRAPRRGWQVILFGHCVAVISAEVGFETAPDHGIELRFLPRRTPALGAMDHFWRFIKVRAFDDRLANSVGDFGGRCLPPPRRKASRHPTLNLRHCLKKTVVNLKDDFRPVG
jgi:hypothetical protein